MTVAGTAGVVNESFFWSAKNRCCTIRIYMVRIDRGRLKEKRMRFYRWNGERSFYFFIFKHKVSMK